jgi:uncharacterized repeat protein (TIGR01451 family)
LVQSFVFPSKAAAILEVNQTTGRDNGISPFRTIQAAITAAGPGDIVEITDSKTYAEQVTITGPEKNGLTLRAAVGESPTIAATYRAITVNWAAGVTIDGIHISSEFESIAFQDSAHDGTVRNLTITSVQEGVEVEHGARNCTIENVTFLKSCPGVKLEGPSSGHIVRNSRFYDTKQALFIGQAGAVTSTLFENNLLIWGVKNEHILIEHGSDIVIRHNVIYEAEKQGIHVGQRSSNITIEHNTIVQTLTTNPREEIINLASDGIDGSREAILFHDHSSGSITNNIIVANGQWAAITTDASVSLIEDFNVIFNSGPETSANERIAFGPNTIVADPLFLEKVLNPTLWRDIPEPVPPYAVDLGQTPDGPKLDFVPCDFAVSAGSPSRSSASDLTDRGAIQTKDCLRADLMLTQVDNPNSITAGSNLTHTLAITNNGPDPAPDVALTEALPASVIYDSAIPGQGSCTETDSIVTCFLGTLASNASATVTIQVVPLAAGTITSTASVTTTLPDPDLSNNTVIFETTVTPVADLSISQSSNPNLASVGATLNYELRVSNAGPSPATAVTVTDALPTGVIYGSAISSQGSCTQANGIITCPLGTLVSNASATVTVQVMPLVAGTITNTASVTTTLPDPDLSNNTTIAETTIMPVADLSISQSNSPNPANVGATLNYELRVSNAGPSPATEVTFTDTLPAGVIYGSAIHGRGSCAEAEGIVVCNLGTLANNASVTVTIEITPTAIGTITNTASATSAVADPNPGNNATTGKTTIRENNQPGHIGRMYLPLISNSKDRQP